MLGTRENKIGVSRTSSVFGGSRTRSVLGRSVLGGDDLDGGADELPAATMGVGSSSRSLASLALSKAAKPLIAPSIPTTIQMMSFPTITFAPLITSESNDPVVVASSTTS
ncbi:hypothetical protein CFP56_007362 [Quercus suber]|uniref:Uncharacterized protein n=1 Tax=Quercus suber TaxID=58331 RepID=A0AAW0L7R6_QUESU